MRLTVEDPAVLGAACGELKGLMDRVDKAASRFRVDSELSVVNRRAGALVPVSRLLVDLVDVSLVAARVSGGAVDPTVGPAVVAAGYDADIEAVRRRFPPSHEPQALDEPSSAPRVAGGVRRFPPSYEPQALDESSSAPWVAGGVRGFPPAAQVQSASGGVVGWREVRLNRKLALLGVPKGCALDLGATAKAWTADRAANLLSKRYGCAVLVEIGGDLRAAGAPKEPWVVTVAERCGGPGVLVTLTHGGLATSTRTVRRWRTADGYAHHVIDPRTGRPAEGAYRTASVWAPTAVRANTFSTALVATSDAALGRLKLASHPARLIGADGEVTELSGWPAASRAA
ncbi:FAD:protein FMN transferase [Kribbella solani]|uniref:FAD:protein FMN transferase n=1 Tax=Kribbella solani TaxID=236067 RepID=UPI0029A497EA|nr:FAD:protein FMN transferase [Kribbella solani]MDX3004426.1 FAD:protein FMN transferase [Kribbella solani]